MKSCSANELMNGLNLTANALTIDPQTFHRALFRTRNFIITIAIIG